MSTNAVTPEVGRITGESSAECSIARAEDETVGLTSGKGILSRLSEATRHAAKSVATGILNSRLGVGVLSFFVAIAGYRVFAPRTVALMKHDLARAMARARMRSASSVPPARKLHFGCGGRRVAGWLNVDIAGSECDVDLAAGQLPWADESFDAIVGQHVIEHLELQSELLPLLRELHRVAAPGAQLWVSCPSMERVCRSYVECKGVDLIEDRRSRPHTTLGVDHLPPQQMINEIFHQRDQHRQLFDFELLKWALEEAEFRGCARTTETELLAAFPEFPRRNDDYHSLYVKATK